MTITISHSHADGTLISGSRRGDGVFEVLKAQRANWRWFPSIGRIGLGQSRDKDAKTWVIDAAAAALRAAGFEVAVEIAKGEFRSFAEAEAERAQRAEARAERFEERAERTGAQADADYQRARQMAEAIPFGQPVMPDHHSYRRDMSYRNRMSRTYDRAFAGMDEAKELQRRARSAEAGQAHRESIPATLRRIEKLEAEERGVKRSLAGRPDYVADGEGGYKLALVKPSGSYRERLERRAADLAAELAYWREHVAGREAEGVKVWRPADFAKGDFAHGRWGWAEVLRVNPKSLTVPWGANAVHLPVVTADNVKDAMGGGGWTTKVTYDDVRGRKSAAEMSAFLADPGQEGATS
jgi:hypothetical protein